MTFRVKADQDICIASQQCALDLPAVFGSDDDMTVTVLDPTPPPESHAAVRRAARLCPASAISIEED